LDLVW